MSVSVTIEGVGYTPAEPVLVIPNRVDMAVLQALEETLGRDRKIAWIVERSTRPAGDIMAHMIKNQSPGILFRVDPNDHEQLMLKIRTELQAGRHVALLPCSVPQPAACAADVSLPLLHYLLDGYDGVVLPVYAGMYATEPRLVVVSQAPYDKVAVRLLRSLAGGGAQAEAVYAAWLEAGADQLSELTAAGKMTLSRAILDSLLENSEASIIDGVDDSGMSYRQLLFLAAPLARHLRKHTAAKRMGVILPPGKLAIVANVACILAGITPVNIDYSYDRTALERVSKMADLTRYITDHYFIQMQQEFAWPRHRDMVFIDEIIQPSGLLTLSGMNFLRRWLTSDTITKWIRTAPAEPHEEALAVFSPAEEGAAVRGASLSHRAVLAGVTLSRSRFQGAKGQRILSTVPFHYNVGLLSGLIYPLLTGQDIITYPLLGAGKRICRLAKQYAPVMAVFTPRQVREVMARAQEGDFAAVAHFLVAGKVSEEDAQRAYQQHRIFMCECYMPLEMALPVACNLSPENYETSASPCAITGGAPGASGLPLPGVAVRITDIVRTGERLPLSSEGLVWVKSPGLYGGRPGQAASAAAMRAHESWLCTGDVGCIRPDGLLSIGGPRSRFSRVKGMILSHEKIEQLLVDFLKAEQAPGKPSLAVIGLPDAEGGDDLIVLLSTLHKVVNHNTTTTLYYALSNAHLKAEWTPNHIIPMRAIPILPCGDIDYALCRAIARKALGRNPA